ncbi:MAG: glycosyltransferase family 2 protein [Deltaproteobacteria bacterium]
MQKPASPLVSIIIPCYKAEKELPQALDSISKQTYTNWEIIAVNDCWEDETEQIIASFKTHHSDRNVTFIRHSKNQGLGATRNTGMQAARGELIAFLDHDDIWEPDHLLTGLTLINDNQADIYYSSVIVFDHLGKKDDWVWGPTLEDLTNFPNSLFGRNYIQPSTAIIRVDFLNKLGPMDTDPNIHFCEDHDYWIRAANLSGKFVTSPKITSRYRSSNPEAATAKTVLMLKHDLTVQKKHLTSRMFDRDTKTQAISSNYRRLADHFWRDSHFKSLFYLTLCIYWHPKAWKNIYQLIKGTFYWPSIMRKFRVSNFFEN